MDGTRIRLVKALRRRWPDHEAAREALGRRRLVALATRLPADTERAGRARLAMAVLGERKWSNAAGHLQGMLSNAAFLLRSRRLDAMRASRRPPFAPTHGAPTEDRLQGRALAAAAGLKVAYRPVATRDGRWTLVVESPWERSVDDDRRRRPPPRAVVRIDGHGVRAWTVPTWAETPALAARIVEHGREAAFRGALEALGLPADLVDAGDRITNDEWPLRANLEMALARGLIGLMDREGIPGNEFRTWPDSLAEIVCGAPRWLHDRDCRVLYVRRAAETVERLPSATMRLAMRGVLMRRVAELGVADRLAPSERRAA